MALKETISTPLTQRLGITHPIILAGMSGVSHGELAAAVSNAGGMGVIGGLTLSPKILRKEIADLKEHLTSKDLPFGVDLAIPQIGGNARKTNHDYTHGHLPELIDIIIEEKARLFVCAVGVPPRWATDKLHAAGIYVMNMVGAPKHVDKALEAGVDFICAQGTEAGGHTGDVATLPLIPQCVSRVKGKKSPLDGKEVLVVGAGGITSGKSMAAVLNLGAAGAWVGTRFVASVESHASDRHKKAIVESGALDTVRTLIFSGRPLRTFNSAYVKSWEVDRKDEIQKLCDQGIVPISHDFNKYKNDPEQLKKDGFDFASAFPMLFGQGCGDINDIKPAGDIVREMVQECVETLQNGAKLVAKL